MRRRPWRGLCAPPRWTQPLATWPTLLAGSSVRPEGPGCHGLRCPGSCGGVCSANLGKWRERPSPGIRPTRSTWPAACDTATGQCRAPNARQPAYGKPDNPTPLPQEIARSIRLVSRTHPRPSPGARPPTAIPMPTTVTASVCTSASTALVEVPPPSSPSISMRVTVHAAADLAGRPKCRRGAADALRLVVCRSPLHRVAVQGRIRGCLTLCSCQCPRLGPLSRSFKGPQSPLNADACPSKLSITAFVAVICPLARTHDHAEAALTPGETPGAPAQGPQNTRASARQVKPQA